MKKLNKNALKYLSVVWGYDSVEKMDTMTALCILENVREATEKHNTDWPFDLAIWKAFAERQEISPDISIKDFTSQFFPVCFLCGFEKNNSRHIDPQFAAEDAENNERMNGNDHPDRFHMFRLK